ncbi:MAG TPA: hypothetical protein VFP89_11710 [Propionibacteriaceae bacterium]|nr:hypothetical protein [Propionibacteriaceae bacterium]
MALIQLPSTTRFAVVDALNDDWAYLLSNPPSSISRWRTVHPALRGCADLTDVLAAVRDDSDAALHALLSELGRGDALAGRVVLQAMLGRIVAMANRDRRRRCDEYVTAMWCRIRTYPLQARPVRIAANLALDTLKAVLAEDQAPRSRALCLSMPPDATFDAICSSAVAARTLDHNPTVGLTGQRLISTALELGLIDAGTQAVMQSVYIEGMTSSAAGREHALSAANVRFRCSRGVRRLAQNSRRLLEAA